MGTQATGKLDGEEGRPGASLNRESPTEFLLAGLVVSPKVLHKIQSEADSFEPRLPFIMRTDSPQHLRMQDECDGH